MSGKSLIIDVMKASLFSEIEIPSPKERMIAHYRGAISGIDATISLVNAYGDVSGLYRTLGRVTRGHSGFIFIANKPRCSLLSAIPQFQKPRMDINVTFPANEKLSWKMKYLGYKPDTPNTEARTVSITELQMRQ